MFCKGKVSFYIKKAANLMAAEIYPVIHRAVRPPPQNSAKAKKLGEGRAARKSPIGSTNNQ